MQTQHFIMSPRQHTQLHMVRTRGRQPMELQCHLALHAFSRYYSLWGDWCRNAQFGKEILQSDLYSSRLLKTEQKHLPWWLSLIWQNINLDLVPKKCTSSKTYILSSSRTWCSYRGCQRLSLFHPTQSASIPMLHGAVSIPWYISIPSPRVILGLHAWRRQESLSHFKTQANLTNGNTLTMRADWS